MKLLLSILLCSVLTTNVISQRVDWSKCTLAYLREIIKIACAKSFTSEAANRGLEIYKRPRDAGDQADSLAVLDTHHRFGPKRRHALYIPEDLIPKDSSVTITKRAVNPYFEICCKDPEFCERLPCP